MAQLSPSSLTPKQEAFAQEVANGSTYSESYRRSYNTENYNQNSLNVEASNMMSNPKILLRVDELRKENRERNAVTVDSITKKLEVAYEMSIQDKQNSSAVSAQMGIAKLHGLLIEKKQIEQTSRITINEDNYNELKREIENIVGTSDDE